MTERIDTVIVGAGPAGLATSALLTIGGHDHVVLERGRVGETWRSQRWDAFHLNTPASISGLPFATRPADPAAFAARDEVVAGFERYAGRYGLPVREHTEVLAVRPGIDGLLVTTSEGRLRARHVVVAAGAQNTPRVPAAAAGVPGDVLQLHSAEYRRPDALPSGAVLVVGGAQTGAQITEDLLAAGRDVYLATSKVARIPRRHRGRDTTEWFRDTGWFDQHPSEVAPAMRGGAQPLVSGTRGGHSLSLQSLARAGAVLLGRLEGVDEGRAVFAGDLAEHLAHGDRTAAETRARIDGYIAREGLAAPPAEDDPADAPLRHVSAPRTLDLRTGWIGTVIWATGFERAWGWLGARDSGVHVLGVPWLARRGSGSLYGIGRDAADVAARITTGRLERLAA